MAGGGSFTSDQSSTRIASTGQVKTVSGGSTNLTNCRITYIQAKGSGAFATDASVVLKDSIGTGGNIIFEGNDITKANPSTIVKNGVFQVMEGRRCIADMTVEENLKLGAHTRKDRKNIKNTMLFLPKIR